MSASIGRFAAAASVAALLVAAVGLAAAPAGHRQGVLFGAAAALLVQLGLFWVLGVLLFPDRRMLAMGLSMLGRFTVFGLLALVFVPLLGLPLAATLFTLIGVFFVTSVLEPVFFGPEPMLRR